MDHIAHAAVALGALIADPDNIHKIHLTSAQEMLCSLHSGVAVPSLTPGRLFIVLLSDSSNTHADSGSHYSILAYWLGTSVAVRLHLDSIPNLHASLASRYWNFVMAALPRAQRGPLSLGSLLRHGPGRLLFSLGD